MLKFNGGRSIVTLGELLLRLSSVSSQRILQSKEMIATFCGAEANVAVSLANFGLNSKFVSALPNNDIGKAGVRELRYFGVDVDNIIFSDNRIGTYYFENGASQRPSKVIYDRKSSAFSLSNITDYNWNKIFDNVCWFHFSGINPALGTNIEDLCYYACLEAKKRDIIVSCDINYRSSLWNRKNANISMNKLMKFVDVCIGNEEDAYNVFDIITPSNNINNLALNKDYYDFAANEIANKYNCKYVAFTLRTSRSASDNRWAGMLYESGSNRSIFSTDYDIHIVDRVGSGDSFSAALIFSLLNNYSLNDSIEFSVAASCLKHTIEGDFNRISISDVELLLKTQGNGRVLR